MYSNPLNHTINHRILGLFIVSSRTVSSLFPPLLPHHHGFLTPSSFLTSPTAGASLVTLSPAPFPPGHPFTSLRPRDPSNLGMWLCPSITQSCSVASTIWRVTSKSPSLDPQGPPFSEPMSIRAGPAPTGLPLNQKGYRLTLPVPACFPSVPPAFPTLRFIEW